MFMDTTVCESTGETSADDGLVEAIIMTYEAALLRYATRMTGNPFAAQDVVQTAFIRLCSHWNGAWQPSPPLKSWLYRVTHNEAVNHLRRESRRQELHAKAALEQPELAVDDPMEARKVKVLEQIDRLKPHEKQVLVLRLQEGCSYAQIADITGRSQGNVGNILHHAVARLAGLVAKG
jgi:RNA polymerase sigma-70 factor (ECF subfamily)